MNPSDVNVLMLESVPRPISGGSPEVMHWPVEAA